jgi:hypothetical protein
MTAWTLEKGMIYCPETSVTNTNIRRVISHYSEDLLYTAAEAWSLAWYTSTPRPRIRRTSNQEMSMSCLPVLPLAMQRPKHLTPLPAILEIHTIPDFCYKGFVVDVWVQWRENVLCPKSKVLSIFWVQMYKQNSYFFPVWITETAKVWNVNLMQQMNEYSEI